MKLVVTCEPGAPSISAMAVRPRCGSIHSPLAALHDRSSALAYVQLPRTIALTIAKIAHHQ